MSLSSWCYVLGALLFSTGLSIVVLPVPMARLYNVFPRSAAAGYVLSTAAWIWAGYALWTMNLDFLMPFVKFIPVAVLVCIPLTWFWLDNLLPCRAFGALLTLFPYDLLHVARVHVSPCRIVLVAFAYLCIIKGMVLLLYPWKMRQALVWLTQRPAVFRLAGIAHALFGLLLIGLGTTVLK